jgi:magnesium transporter
VLEEDAGITELDITETSPLRVTRSRLPWLVVSFIGEIISGYLMSRFEISMTKVLSIVFFVPLIMAVGGNVGNQSAIVIIRGLATGEIGLLETGRRMKNELWIALLLGLILAVGIQAVSGLWLNDFLMGLAIAVSLILVVLNAAMMGTLLPFILRRLKIDPAVATSPFITTSNDILGLLIYFGTISLFLKYFY